MPERFGLIPTGIELLDRQISGLSKDCRLVIESDWRGHGNYLLMKLATNFVKRGFHGVYLTSPDVRHRKVLSEFRTLLIPSEMARIMVLPVLEKMALPGEFVSFQRAGTAIQVGDHLVSLEDYRLTKIYAELFSALPKDASLFACIDHLSSLVDLLSEERATKVGYSHRQLWAGRGPVMILIYRDTLPTRYAAGLRVRATDWLEVREDFTVTILKHDGSPFEGAPLNFKTDNGRPIFE